MKPEHHIVFPPFHLDTVEERLRRDQQPIVLRGKTFAVLRYLVEHPGRLVTKDELLRIVWPDTHVSAGVLTVCMTELRKALGDDAQAPQFIETVHRRGYRFIAPLTSTPPVQRLASGVQRPQPPIPYTLYPTPTLVGRDPELAHLHECLEKALTGERQLIFVTGEAGIGKTTLVEAFLARAVGDSNLWIAPGRCLEQYGSGEAYMPVLEALGRLCRAPGHERLLALLRQHAPLWLAQMPALVSPAEREELQREVLGATRERMLRELAEAVEVLTAERPLMLVLEDLHWSDYSTLDLIAFLAQRQEPARLLLIGTYRPGERGEHPLKAVTQELQVHQQCAELSLALLSETAVAEYLARRFAENRLPAELARAVHQRTEGNPLFMVNVVEYLQAQRVIAQADGRWILQGDLAGLQRAVPQNIRQMIEKQLDRLTPTERRMLEVSSVVGLEFSTATVAAVLQVDVVQVEEWCETLARRYLFLQPGGERAEPERRSAARYQFLHAVYHSTFYERITTARLRQLHQRIGEWQEVTYGDRAKHLAVELAAHFERSQDYRRAVQYLQQAGNTAVERSAYREAMGHLTKGIKLLAMLPDTPDRAQQELALQVGLIGPLIATKGYAAPEVEEICNRALGLCRQMGQTPELFPILAGPVLGGLWTFFLARAQLQTARELAEQRLQLAQRLHNPALLLLAHLALGTTLFYLGEVRPARAHLEEGIALSSSHLDQRYAYLYEFDPAVGCLSYVAWALWLLGYPDQARKRCAEALSWARERAHPHSLAAALNYAAWLHQLCRETQVAHEEAEEALALARKQGFGLWQALGTLLRGSVLAVRGQEDKGLEQMRKGLMWYQVAGAEVSQPYMLALLAEAYASAGQVEEGLELLAAALAKAHNSGERYYQAELYRLKGELMLAQLVHRRV